jgi:glycosyltransferase involved in cell wall biosynthesis
MPKTMPSSQYPDLRICIVAENASFQFGGEASLPLHYYSRLRALGIECWLVVHSRTRDELQKLFPADQDRIRYIPDMWFHKLAWRMSVLLPRRVAEATVGQLVALINQLIQKKIVRRLIKEQFVTLVHQPIPVSPKAPSFIYGLGVPVVIGPMNGGMEYPEAFQDAESGFTRLTVALGRGSANLVNEFIPGKRDADILLVANRRTMEALPAPIKGKVVELPENGVDLSIWKMPSTVEATQPGTPMAVNPRFIFIGRLVDWKRLDLAIRALAHIQIQVPGSRLEVIGDGPMRPVWAGLAEFLGVSDRVEFLGWLPQPECAQRLRDSAALLLPSIYECGGAVVLEAMATGTPVVATNWGGPADYLDSECGILVNPSSQETITSGFTNAMLTLANDAALRARLGAAGRKHVEERYDWNQKIGRILEIYRQAIDAHRS